MTDLTLLETEDALRRLDLRDAIESQSRIERIFNPPMMKRIPIFSQGTVDGVGLAAVRYQSRYIAPVPLFRRIALSVIGWLTLTRGKR